MDLAWPAERLAFVADQLKQNSDTAFLLTSHALVDQVPSNCNDGVTVLFIEDLDFQRHTDHSYWQEPEEGPGGI